MKPHEHDYEFNSSCAAHVCTVFDPDTDEGCHEHKGLDRCWCGWSKTDPGRGYQELAEMGENMEGLPLEAPFPEAARNRRFDRSF